MPRFWFITDATGDLGWSNEDGWVDRHNNYIEVYSDEEKAGVNLPLGGKWVEWVS